MNLASYRVEDLSFDLSRSDGDLNWNSLYVWSYDFSSFTMSSFYVDLLGGIKVLLLTFYGFGTCESETP